VVLGAGRDALAAMICIRFSIISKWAEKNRISFTTYTDLASRPEVYALLRKEVETVNGTLPPAQRIARFLLLYKELDADDGELTRTRKVRRSVINEKYADIIDAIYGGKRDIPVDTVIRFQDGTTQLPQGQSRLFQERLPYSPAHRCSRTARHDSCDRQATCRGPHRAGYLRAVPRPPRQSDDIHGGQGRPYTGQSALAERTYNRPVDAIEADTRERFPHSWQLAANPWPARSCSR
jgi:hypothetical protein